VYHARVHTHLVTSFLEAFDCGRVDFGESGVVGGKHGEGCFHVISAKSSHEVRRSEECDKGAEVRDACCDAHDIARR